MGLFDPRCKRRTVIPVLHLNARRRGDFDSMRMLGSGGRVSNLASHWGIIPGRSKISIRALRNRRRCSPAGPGRRYRPAGWFRRIARSCR